MNNKILRHNTSDIILHWFNALCWFLLLITGLGLLGNHRINPLGKWFPAMMESLCGGAECLLTVHEIIGLIWIGGFLLYFLLNFQSALGFLREIFTIHPRRDLTWMLKKPLQLTLGNKTMRRLGLNTQLPPQGFYNMGQKAFAQPAVILGVIIAITGIIMFLSDKVLTAEYTTLVVWSIGIHYVAVGLVTAGLIIHIFMAAINIEERPAFYSMFSGYVPVEHVRQHNPLWYEEIAQEEQDQSSTLNTQDAKLGMQAPTTGDRI